MSEHVLKLPATTAGQKLAVELIRLAGGWDFPDGTNASDYDFDRLAIEQVALMAALPDRAWP